MLLGRRPDEVALPAPASATTLLRLEEPGAVARRTGREVHTVLLTDTAAAWRARALEARPDAAASAGSGGPGAVPTP